MNRLNNRFLRVTKKSPEDLIVFDQKLAKKIIGKTVLIGKTFQRADGEIIKRTQEHGVVTQADITGGVIIKLHNSDELISLPPDLRSWHKARPGLYTSKTTGQPILYPDYFTAWIVDV